MMLSQKSNLSKNNKDQLQQKFIKWFCKLHKIQRKFFKTVLVSLQSLVPLKLSYFREKLLFTLGRKYDAFFAFLGS